ncbi:MAG TPA: aspartyl-tRNA amidotransferase [Chloroflexi bacterium]|nr:aspartyl-tRNA amidotransferase [Chloroflexota bacterium]HBY09023.1 aspartyl-tRNA amidotransferase [Chloroflexota bacterium]
MNTKDQLSEDLKDAMRAKDELRKRTLRMALAAIKNTEIDKRAALDEVDVLAILQKEVKSRYETIEGAEQAGRADLIAEANAEIAVLEGYLPQALSAEELERIVRETITEVGATSPREMGQVMQAVMPKVRGRADGKEVNQVVRRLLG